MEAKAKAEPTEKVDLGLQFKTMFTTLQAMGLNPKGDTPEEFDNWIQDYVAHSKEHKLTLPAKETGAIPKAVKKEEQLEKTLVMSTHPPKIRSFSGGDNKGETAYDIWRYEVKMLQEDPSYTKTQKNFAIRRALTGSAARMVMYQGDMSIEQVLATLDSVYGTVDSKEQLLSEFYCARQKEDEDVTTWSNRLQEIIGRGLEKKVVSSTEVNSMLRNMIYTGLRQELKDVSGHKYDAIHDFNQLRVALRQIEKEHMPRKTGKPQTAKVATTVDQNKDIEELKGMVQQLTHTVTEMKSQQYQGRPRGNNFRGRGGNRGYNQQPRPSWESQQPPPFRPRIPQQQNPRYNWQQQPPPQVSQTEEQPSIQQQPQEYQYYQSEPVCHRCGQRGHIQIGCRVILDHWQEALNARRPVRRGRY